MFSLVKNVEQQIVCESFSRSQEAVLGWKFLFGIWKNTPNWVLYGDN